MLEECGGKKKLVLDIDDEITIEMVNGFTFKVHQKDSHVIIFPIENVQRSCFGEYLNAYDYEWCKVDNKSEDKDPLFCKYFKYYGDID
jgi:hypothetical protein